MGDGRSRIVFARCMTNAEADKGRTLSPPITFFIKVLFPALWSAGWGWGTLQLLLHPETVAFNGVVGGAPPGTAILFAGAWVVGTIMGIAFGWGLKRVRLSGDELLISNYLHEVRVPITAIRDVRHRFFAHAGSVTLDFDEATRFGSNITFLAKGRRVRFGGEMKVARDLRQLIDAARKRIPDPRTRVNLRSPANEH